jgi:hypothetical protein
MCSRVCLWTLRNSEANSYLYRGATAIHLAPHPFTTALHQTQEVHYIRTISPLLLCDSRICATLTRLMSSNSAPARPILLDYCIRATSAFACASSQAAVALVLSVAELTCQHATALTLEVEKMRSCLRYERGRGREGE